MLPETRHRHPVQEVAEEAEAEGNDEERQDECCFKAHGMSPFSNLISETRKIRRFLPRHMCRSGSLPFFAMTFNVYGDPPSTAAAAFGVMVSQSSDSRYLMRCSCVSNGAFGSGHCCLEMRNTSL